jgi:hypothetical protein
VLNRPLHACIHACLLGARSFGVSAALWCRLCREVVGDGSGSGFVAAALAARVLGRKGGPSIDGQEEFKLGRLVREESAPVSCMLWLVCVLEVIDSIDYTRYMTVVGTENVLRMHEPQVMITILVLSVWLCWGTVAGTP